MNRLILLAHRCNRGKVLAASRMRDITGQQAYVDHLTSQTQRTMLSQQLAAIEREVAKADGDGNAWRTLLGLS